MHSKSELVECANCGVEAYQKGYGCYVCGEDIKRFEEERPNAAELGVKFKFKVATAGEMAIARMHGRPLASGFYWYADRVYFNEE